ncbi:MAG: hypothetical protein FWD61_20165 [Phycisphaerales bacterium]|nr:hypothetical protein [Phycisphaerales bacterium]
MPISIGDALSLAFRRTGNICFRPFDLGKWFIMGFCVFLSTCGDNGGHFNCGSNFNFRRPSGTPSHAFLPGPSAKVFLDNLWTTITSNLHWIIPVAIIVFVIGLAIVLAVMYLRCRGRFMFLDNVIEGRAAIVEPWKRYGSQAYSYFLFSLLLMVLGLVVLLLAGGAGLAIALPDIHARAFSLPSIVGIFVFAGIWLPLSIGLIGIDCYAHDFVLPIMMLRNTSFKHAWHEARKGVIRGHIGQLTLFYLIRTAFAIGEGILTTFAVCCTCCIGGLPYLNSVLTLPIHVFNRAFALAFLEQFHPDYRLMRDFPSSGSGFPVILDSPPPPSDLPSSPDSPSPA